MEFNGREDFDKLRGFRAPWNDAPPKSIALAMMSLLNGHTPTLAFAEVATAGDSTTWILYALANGRLIRVKADGPDGWDWGSADDEGGTVESKSWKIEALKTVSVDEVVRSGRGFSSEIHWAPKMTFAFDSGESVSIPALDFPSQSTNREIIENFNQALLTAWEGTP